MTYAPHLLLSFGGRLFGVEQWACNLRMLLGEPDAAVPVSLATMTTWAEENVEDVALDVAAWFTDGQARNSSAARLDYVKLNPIGANGRYANETETILYEWASGDAPAGVTAPGEPQNSLVVSLLTDATRGRASRGRFYPPTGTITVDSATGYIDDQVTAAVAGAALTLLNNLANMPGVDLQSPRVVVASDLGQPGPVRNVTSVAVGDVMDTQRRRRRSLVETYAGAGPVVIV